MKRILCLCTASLLLIVGYLLYYRAAVQDRRAWENYGMSDRNVTFYITKKAVPDAARFQEALLRLAATHKCNLVLNHVYSENGVTFYGKGVYAQAEGAPELSLPLVGGGVFLLRTLKEGQTLQTLTGQPRLFDLFGDDHVRFSPLRNFWERYGIEGRYTVQAPDLVTAEKLLAALSKTIGVEQNTLLRRQDFHEESVLGNWGYRFLITGLVLLLMYLVTILAYSYKNLRAIAVRRLNGYPAEIIWWQLISPVFFFGLAAALLIDVVGCFLLRLLTRRFAWQVVAAELLLLLFLLLLSGVAYLFIKRQSLNELVKGRSRIRILLVPARLMQILMSVACILLILSQYQLIDRLLSRYRELNAVSVLGDWSLLTASQVGDNMASIAGSDSSLSRDFARFYDRADALGAIYFASGGRLSETTIERVAEAADTPAACRAYLQPSPGMAAAIDLPTLKVNGNYLRQVPLYNAAHQKIQADDQSGELIVCLPLSWRNNPARPHLENLLKVQWMLESGAPGTPPKTAPPTLKICYYGEPRQFTRLDYDPGAILMPGEKREAGVLEEPIVYILTRNNMNESDKGNCMASGLTSPLRLPPGYANTGAFVAKRRAIEKDCHLDDNHLIYMTTKNYLAADLNQTWSGIVTTFVDLLFFLVITLFINWLEALLSFELRKKPLAVMQLYGLGFWARQKGKCLQILLVYFFSVGVAFAVINAPFNGTTCAVALFYFVLLAAMHYGVIRRNEKVSLAAVLKGE